jgi:hypothetical protein
MRDRLVGRAGAPASPRKQLGANGSYGCPGRTLPSRLPSPTARQPVAERRRVQGQLRERAVAERTPRHRALPVPPVALESGRAGGRCRRTRHGHDLRAETVELEAVGGQNLDALVLQPEALGAHELGDDALGEAQAAIAAWASSASGPVEAQEVGAVPPSQPLEPAGVAGGQQHDCVRPPALGAEPNRVNLDRAPGIRVPSEVGAVGDGWPERSACEAPWWQRDGRGRGGRRRRRLRARRRVRRAVVQRSPVGGACPPVEVCCPRGMASGPPVVSGSIVWASWPPPICTRRGLAASATGIVSVSTPCS